MNPAATAARRPSSPNGVFGRLAFTGFAKDPLAFIERLTREHPGAARLPMPGLSLVYLTDRDALGELLLDRDHLFTKDWTTRALRAVLGNGLFTSEGELWRRQRALVAPPLQRKRIGDYVALTARRATAYARLIQPGQIRDVKPDMTHLTMGIVAEALFGADIGDAAPRVAAALERALSAYEDLIYTWRRFIPGTWNQPVRARLGAAGAELGAIVDEVIARKQAAADSGRASAASDLLSRLLEARDETGSAMSPTQLRDEVVTMLLAGHETTAMALTFALDFLARHPAIADAVAAEATAVLAGTDVPNASDIARLGTATAAFKETLRLRPPLWLFGREASADTVVGKWRIEKGEQVLVSPWLMHHDARWFDDPTTFRPARWTADFEESLPRHVYLPFGAGPRVCAGLHLALMEGTLVLATLCRAFRFTPTEPGEIRLNPGITLRPRSAVRLRFETRS